MSTKPSMIITEAPETSLGGASQKSSTKPWVLSQPDELADPYWTSWQREIKGVKYSSILNVDFGGRPIPDSAITRLQCQNLLNELDDNDLEAAVTALLRITKGKVSAGQLIVEEDFLVPRSIKTTQISTVVVGKLKRAPLPLFDDED